ncbi:hypothetical protein HMPREF1222_02238 [Treponema vincentii F0403]|uniref:TraB/GumN family protein n=2 Tax=Treponema vincentii TaxID=69710 RepID=S3MA93_9SPIR|nr:TraB/GumN family protein [Treponema vincentii]EEV19322.1 GumN protein [Treponema vincentii ATCC 35580]EPF45949.1 hypothetical protein HMPREF1222_02238 [Treponema vincentii F0403]
MITHKYLRKILPLFMLGIMLTACTTTGQVKQKHELPNSVLPVLIEHPERFFWEIRGNKGSVYVLGTVHVADKSFYPLQKNVLDAFDKADRLVSELGGMPEMEAFVGEMQSVIIKNMNADPKKSLLNVLSEDDLAFLYETIGDDTVHQLALFNPWILNTVLAQFLMSKIGLNAGDGIDMYLIQRAENKKIEALDTAQQQIAVLSYGTFDDQLAMLKDSIQALRDIDANREEMHKVRDLYLSNNRKELSAMLVDLLFEVPSSFSEKKTQAYIDTLLTDRNRIWAQKFGEYLREGGNTFVFAGTAHFLGKSSVFEIMRQKNMLK